MDDELRNPQDTREFMAMWNTVTADHLTHKLASVLPSLGRRVPASPQFDESHAAAIAPVLIRAFQVAASPEGGVHAAVQFLAEYGTQASA
ncbi:MAG TPA: hypothetical protein VMY76_14535 [Gemmatimonadales bacterium]|nr:hypothetical protein [Gemmatimonadales bacterium]